MHTFVERSVLDFHSQYFKTVDAERIFNEDEIVCGDPKTVVIGNALVWFDARNDFRAFQRLIDLDVIGSLRGRDLHDVVT